jgi:hypothetical protein
MHDKSFIMVQIELYRDELNKAIDDEINLVSEQVMELSQKLDDIIKIYYKITMDEKPRKGSKISFISNK